MQLFVEKGIKHKNNVAVTKWMLCVNPHIIKDESDNSDGEHRKQVNNVLKTLFYGLSEDEFNFTLDLFWTEYTDLNNNNIPFNGD